MDKKYEYIFYEDRHQKTLYSANKILTIVINSLPKVDSAVDFGCGVGTWLSVLKEKGVKEIQGMDGPWVAKHLLEISKKNFREIDFEKPVKLNKRYDLAISLEVAEHLKPEFAETFVETLVNTSDFILFSAAIPYQGGYNHFNEQWPNYWVALFNEKGYVALDFIRREIWEEKEIPIWYRQNMLVFVLKKRIKEINSPQMDNICNLPLALVHPEMYLLKINQMNSVIQSWGLFQCAIKKWFKKKLNIK